MNQSSNHKFILKRFIVFLIKEKILEQYIKHLTYKENAIWRLTYNSPKDSIEYIVQTILQNPKYIIKTSFHWEKTIEGHSFWYGIHRKWMVEYEGKINK